MAPDYNDGRWHGWNGGECPVHPNSEVEAVCKTASGHSGFGRVTWKTAGDMTWDDDSLQPIVAFRVVKEYREPRELWHLLDHAGEVFDTFTDKDVAQYRANDCPGFTLVHYREVTHGEAQ